MKDKPFKGCIHFDAMAFAEHSVFMIVFAGRAELLSQRILRTQRTCERTIARLPLISKPECRAYLV